MIIHELWIIWTFLGLFQVFSPIFKCFEMIGLPLRTKLQIKEFDSVTKIIKSHQKVSLRTILHVNIIIKSLRTSAIGYFLTIITIWPIESRKNNVTWFEKWALDLTFVMWCRVVITWPSRRAHNQISIQIFEIHSFKPNIIGSKNSMVLGFRTLKKISSIAPEPESVR